MPEFCFQIRSPHGQPIRSSEEYSLCYISLTTKAVEKLSLKRYSQNTLRQIFFPLQILLLKFLIHIT